MLRLDVCVAAVLAVLPIVSWAEQHTERTWSDAGVVGDARLGESFANAQCAECHAVEAGATASPVAAATPFATLADTPGVNSRALTVWLTTFHPERTMPLIVMEEEERADVIAYILGLATEE